MKLLYKSAKSLIIILILVAIIFYNINTLENFQGNTLKTLENLPSWIIYLAIIIGMIIALGTLVAKIYPYVLGIGVAREGISTAGNVGRKWINAAYAKPAPTPSVPPPVSRRNNPPPVRRNNNNNNS